jgi:hypothetical protein
MLCSLRRRETTHQVEWAVAGGLFPPARLRRQPAWLTGASL